MYSRLSSDGRIEPSIFPLILSHHIRRKNMGLEEYALFLGVSLDHVERVINMRANPSREILKDMKMKFTPTCEGFYENE